MAHQFPQPPPMHGQNLDDILGDIGFDSAYAQPKKGKAGKTGVGAAKAKGKDKDKDKDKLDASPVVTKHEGFLLSRIPSEKGKPIAAPWTRVGKRTMPIEESKLVETALDHRRRTGRSAAEAFQALTSSQQGIIDRLIAEKMHSEKHPNAVWTLFDVKRIEKDVKVNFLRVSRELDKLRVILKRQDMRLLDKKDKSATNPSIAYGYGEIIDITQPMKAPNSTQDGAKKSDKTGGKGENKKSKQHRDDDIVGIIDESNDFEDIVGRGGYGGDFQDHHQDNWDKQHDERFAGWDAPPGAIPIPVPMDQRHPQQQQQQQQQYQPYQQQPNAPPQAPMAPHPHPNPFFPEVGDPAQYDFPPFDPAMEQTMYGAHHARPATPARGESQSRSRSRHRRLEIELDLERQERQRLADKMDDLILSNAVNAWSNRIPGDSSQGSAANRWSPPPLSAGSFTPPSTPDLEPRSFLQRRASHNDRGGRVYFRDRRGSYHREGAELQPGVTYRHGRDRQHGDGLRRQRSRPHLTHANTYNHPDDYPGAYARGRRDDSRYVSQRRLTDYPEGYVDAADFGVRGREYGTDFTRVEGRRERDRRVHDKFEPQYDRRDDKIGRRNSVFENAGGYHY